MLGPLARGHVRGGADPLDDPAAVVEAICNETYAQYGCEVTCLWDARRHSTLMIENVRSLHNHELGPEGWEPSLGYVGPRHYLAGRNEVPLPPAGPPEWTVDLDDLDGLPRLRAEVQDWAGRHGFAGSAAADVLLAVAEVATNGLVHGRPPVRVYGWRQHNTLVVQADDRGGIPLPPLAGYLPPGQQPPSQRGLWLARQLADVVQARTVDGVTSVRLYFPYRLTHRNPARLTTHRLRSGRKGCYEISFERTAIRLRQVQEVHARWPRRLRGGGKASTQRELDELSLRWGSHPEASIAIMTCSQYLTGPNGGPATFCFPGPMQKPGN